MPQRMMNRKVVLPILMATALITAASMADNGKIDGLNYFAIMFLGLVVLFFVAALVEITKLERDRIQILRDAHRTNPTVTPEGPGLMARLFGLLKGSFGSLVPEGGFSRDARDDLHMKYARMRVRHPRWRVFIKLMHLAHLAGVIADCVVRAAFGAVTAPIRRLLK